MCALAYCNYFKGGFERATFLPFETMLDDAVNLTSELYDSNARKNHLRKRKKEMT